MEQVYLWIVLFPLIGSIIAGLFGHKIGRAGAHWVAIIGVALSFLLSLVVLFRNRQTINVNDLNNMKG